MIQAPPALTINYFPGGCVISKNNEYIVGLSLHPMARMETSKQELPHLVVAEDEDREGQGDEPPPEVERVHPQSLVHPGAVAEEHGLDSL